MALAAHRIAKLRLDPGERSFHVGEGTSLHDLSTSRVRHVRRCCAHAFCDSLGKGYARGRAPPCPAACSAPVSPPRHQGPTSSLPSSWGTAGLRPPSPPQERPACLAASHPL